MNDARTLPLLLLLGALCCITATPSAADPLDPVGLSHASMVIVSSNIAPHQDAIGAGVIVAVQPHRIRVITARHVAERGPVTIWIAGRPWPAEIVRTLPNRDLAIIDAVGVPADPLRTRPATLAPATTPGSPLVIWGENESGLRIEPGSVVTPAYEPPDGISGGPLLSITCGSCAHGDSGGGIFDAEGRLLGILTARYHTPDDRTIAIVGERIDASIYAITDGPVEIAASTRSVR